MSTSSKVGFLTSVLALLSLLGCAKQNSRTTTKIDMDASVRGDLPWQPQDGRVITVWINPKEATMSTLLGNQLAVDFVRSSGSKAYPAGSSIALVTWRQKEDERWFGGSIPSTVKSIEFVTIKTSSAHSPEYFYQRFDGNPLHQSLGDGMSTPQGRVEYLLSLPAARMP